MLSLITDQSRASPASISAAGRRASSFARCSAAIVRPVSPARRTRSAAEAKGWGTAGPSSPLGGCSSSCAVSTKPPPIE